MSQRVVEQGGDLACRCSHRLGLADACGEPSIEGAQRHLCATDGYCSQPQQARRLCCRIAAFASKGLCPRDLVGRPGSSQGSEVFGVWPSGEIGSALTDEFQRQRRTQAMNLRQVDAEDRMQCGSRIEGRRIGRFVSMTSRRQPPADFAAASRRRRRTISIRKSHSTTLAW